MSNRLYKQQADGLRDGLWANSSFEAQAFCKGAVESVACTPGTWVQLCHGATHLT